MFSSMVIVCVISKRVSGRGQEATKQSIAESATGTLISSDPYFDIRREIRLHHFNRSLKYQRKASANYLHYRKRKN